MTLQFSLDSIWYVWRRDGVGYSRRFVGTVRAVDAYRASTEARRQYGPGRYQIRASKWGAPVLAHA